MEMTWLEARWNCTIVACKHEQQEHDPKSGECFGVYKCNDGKMENCPCRGFRAST